MPRQFLDDDDTTVSLCFKLPARLATRARRKARQQGFALSVVLRSLLAEWLEDPAPARFKRKP